MPLTQELAAFCAALRYEDLPGVKEVLAKLQ